MSFLGLDFGASFLKGAVLDSASGSIRHVVRIPFPAFLKGLPPGHREVDSKAVTAAFTKVLDLLLEAEPKPEMLVLCSQMHGFIFTDEAGRPLSNYHSWQDQRAEEIDPKTGHTFFEESTGRLTESDQAALGREIRPGLPSSQLFWLAQKKLLPPGARACALADFILAQACGQSPVTEATLASSHGLWNGRTGDWHQNVLSKLELPGSLLPKIVPSGSLVGTLDWRGRKIPYYTPVGDQQCALVGVGLRENELSLNIATGSQVSLRSKTFEPGSHQVRPYFDGEFLRTITHIPAGRSLNALIRLFTELHPESDSDRTWGSLIEKMEQIPETDARADLSFFSGAFGSQGALTHLREENLTVGHLFLAALENMARNYGEAAQRISPEKAWKSLVLSGGLAQKIVRLQRLVQREFPCPQRLPAFPEDTLRGLLILGSFWSGRHGNLAGLQTDILTRSE